MMAYFLLPFVIKPPIFFNSRQLILSFFRRHSYSAYYIGYSFIDSNAWSVGYMHQQPKPWKVEY